MRALLKATDEIDAMAVNTAIHLKALSGRSDGSKLLLESMLSGCCPPFLENLDPGPQSYAWQRKASTQEEEEAVAWGKALVGWAEVCGYWAAIRRGAGIRAAQASGLPIASMR